MRAETFNTSSFMWTPRTTDTTDARPSWMDAYYIFTHARTLWTQGRTHTSKDTMDTCLNRKQRRMHAGTPWTHGRILKTERTDTKDEHKDTRTHADTKMIARTHHPLRGLDPSPLPQKRKHAVSILRSEGKSNPSQMIV